LTDDESLSLPFTIGVPCAYRAPRPGLPLVLAFHGKCEDETAMPRRVGEMGEDFAWAFPRAPYPEEYEFRGHARIGYSWYQYTGDAEAFAQSLRVTGGWVLRLLERILDETKADPERIYLMGFSQGGYLAGSMALTMPERFAGAALFGSRYKTELIEDGAGSRRHLRLFSAHGKSDRFVKPEPAARCAAELKEAGLAVQHREYRCGHRVLPDMIDDALAHLIGR
jgi:phospholipase/carboxylesterase